MKVLTYLAVGSTLLLAACSTASEPANTSRPSAAGSVTRSTPMPDTPSPEPSAVGTARCGVDAGVVPHPFTLRVARAELPAAVIGTGEDVAVLLHQTDGDGACGWFPVAGMMASQQVRVIAFDMCGYGAAECPTTSPTPAQQVRAAVDWARAHGGRRVTVVGASMGGSIALGTASAVRPDAVVDLSGPMAWGSVVDSAVAAHTVRVPLLGAAAKDDPDSEPAALRKAVMSSPATHRFVQVPHGHGIEMLTSYRNGKDAPTALLRTVVRWIKGGHA